MTLFNKPFRRAPKKKAVEETEPKKKTVYTLKLDAAKMAKLQAYCQGRHDYAPYEVDYAQFAYKGPDFNLVAYTSGKLVIQGKGTEEFVQNVLEPEVTGDPRLGYDEIHHPDWFEPHAGLDESGKGDLFGPLVSACVIADGDMVRKWREAGLQDSKKMSEAAILRLDRIIRGTRGVVIETTVAGMRRYNEMMARPGANLNKLLAWYHARCLERALAKKTVPWGLLDQFSKQPLTQRELKVKDFDLRMRTKAEEDPVVAAASVVASAEFTRAMKNLGARFGEPLPKGAGAPAKEAARAVLKKLGPDALPDFVKMHFKTTAEVLREVGK